MPPGPSSPNRMPTPRKVTSSGAPMRRETKPAKMAAHSSRPQKKISWLVDSIRPRALRSDFDGETHLVARGARHNGASPGKRKKRRKQKIPRVKAHGE